MRLLYKAALYKKHYKELCLMKIGKFEITKRIKIVAIVALAAVLLIAAILGIGAIVGTGTNAVAWKNTTKTPKVMYYSEYLGTVERNIPSTMENGGLPEYPKYGYTLKSVLGDANASKRTELIRESNLMTTSNTWNGGGYFNMMDKDGNLLKDGVPVTDGPTKLYKHTASAGMYLGDVDDSEAGIIKKLTFSPRSYGRYYNVTGVYAPAGEVIKIEMSEEDMNATNGITIHIGQALYNGKANNIWTAKNAMNRMPVIMSTFVINKTTATLDNGVYTAYVGSFLGGPVYVRHSSSTFSVTISGGVRYSHYIYGYTTEKEFEENAKSSAPYFDLEVWDNGVLHSGPKTYAKNFSYDDLTKAAELWDKIALVSTKVSTQGIVFLYDPFVAAGAAVAFPGQGSVNCPSGWMSSSLNYKSFTNSGAWGNMHEYNHNFQSGWGRGNGGEVTNNALNIVEYSLFTNISSHRKIGLSGDGLGGWNRYTSPSWSLNQTLLNAVDGVNPEYPLNEYSTVIHNLGQEVFMDAIHKQRTTSAYTTTYTGWYGALSETSHYDFTYFFSDILRADLDAEIVDKIQSKKYPAFIPAASIYQTGRSFYYYEYEKMLDENGQETAEDNPDKIKSKTKKYCETAKPYVIPYGQDFTVDLSPYTLNEGGQYQSGSVVLPSGFTYKIKKVSSPEHGKMKKGNDNVYTFVPDKKNLESGKIYVTLEIKKEGESTKFDDIELVLEFKQSYEMNKNVIERTSYSYETPVYTDAVEAYENEYKGYKEVVSADNKNPVQNSNSEVWYTSAEDVPQNGVVEIKGKLYISESGKYRVALRGRYNCALYVAVVDDKTDPSAVKPSDYKLAARITNASGGAGFTLAEGTYSDFEDLHAGQWLYYKAVMICTTTPRISFIGLGWGKFETMGGTIDEEGNVVGGVEDTPPKISYATSYRNEYKFDASEFKTEYFYEHSYNVTYSNVLTEIDGKSIVELKNFTPWDDTLGIEHLIDNDTTNYMHSKEYVSAEKPFDMTVDLGKIISASRVTFYGYDMGKKHTPTTFEFYVGDTPDSLKLVAKITNGGLSGHNSAFNLTDGEQNFRYYRLVVTDTATHQYIALREIEFSVSATGNLFGPRDERFEYGGKNAWSYENAFASFGQIAVGTAKASFEFEFTGTRVALYSVFGDSYGGYTVYVDGKKQAVVNLGAGNGQQCAFITETRLKQGKHKVKIKPLGKKDVKINIAAIGVWE